VFLREVYVGKAFRLKYVFEAAKLESENLAGRVIGVTTDLFIAVTLCTLLHLSRTGFKKSDAMITKLIIFTVNTGLITSFCALGSLISVVTSPNTYIHIGWFFCLSRLYTNCLLATLNARGIIRGSFIQDGTMSFALTNFKTTEASQHAPESIKIDTIHQNTGEKVHDGNSGSVEESV